MPTEGGKPDALYGWPEDGLCLGEIRPGTLSDSLHKGFRNLPELILFSSGSLRSEGQVELHAVPSAAHRAGVSVPEQTWCS